MAQKLPEFFTVGPLPEINLGFVSLPTYYLVISLTYCICILWFYKRCEIRNLSQQRAMDLGMILLIAGFLGARLFHILFELPEYYLENPIEIINIWQGGFVFFGGFITAYLCAVYYARKNKLTFWLWHDTLAPVIALGYAMGRIACFLVGCCYGKVCELPWAYSLKQVHIASENISHITRHPTQLYAVGIELLILGFLLWFEKKRPPIGYVFLTWLGLHSLGRIFMEFFRDDPRGSEFFGLSISTWISMLLIIYTLIVFSKLKKGPTK